MLVFAIAFLIAVITGKTTLPIWAGIFNLLPLAIVIMTTKIPAKANVIGVIMFAGLIQHGSHLVKMKRRMNQQETILGISGIQTSNTRRGPLHK